ncbi:MAG: hypothetical protein OEW89_11750 [Gammaproteobacteria bacterium]|nr:hypothetical protein [Gammaproteobacteria bacterium]
MEWLNEILGFVVLSGPLVVLVIWLPVSLLIAVKLGKRFRGAGIKVIGGLVIFAIAFILPFADEIAGRVYLNYLCETKAGVKVYQTVELPAEYWDEDGRPKFIQGIGSLDTSVLSKYMTDFKNEKYSSLFDIKKFRFWYSEKESGKVVAEVNDFHYVGGWIIKNFTPNGASGEKCQRPELLDSKGIILSIFMRAEKLRSK